MTAAALQPPDPASVDDATLAKYEVVIGLEVHCQLTTKTKIFSSASTAFGAEPNTQVCEVDLGLPGALPALNGEAVRLAIIAGLATGCTVNPYSQFARKNYFYPDLPKGYQISQHTLPICSDGGLEIVDDQGQTKLIRIERIHMEEDAGKSSHLSGQPFSLINLNRAGVPLIEIVSHPDMRSADEAVAYLKALHALVVFLGVCDGNMEEGSFRCDSNVSVRLRGEQALGTRAELKNINSFKFIRDAIQYEVRRQIALVEAGQRVIQQTRLYDADRGQTFAMRDKEESHDYRYFPEPDLPPLALDPTWIAQLKAELPELPHQKRARYVAQLGLSDYDAGVLTQDRALSTYFEEAAAAYTENVKGIANWIINELLRELNQSSPAQTPDQLKLTPQKLAALVSLIDQEVVSNKLAKTVFEEVLASGDEPEAIIEAKGLRQITDPAQLQPMIDKLILDNPDKVEQYRQGQTKMRTFFMGQLMRATQGKASPKLLNTLLDQALEAPST